ncbi:hypothetical protein NLG97_g7289 [Lecanicillium saksenae]|uniref:Uncharacterized protein n=1 Tax=Lecanicillium saksenae TaxID=468837 RepID=A0ACC1QM96_9HYPO|nr:hypothetical protein NLG97_g7289 [Lecanicillium saksenae]
MRQIYFRASTVIVWLGKKYERYAEELPQLQLFGCEGAAATVTPEELESAGDAAESSSASSRLARELYEDEYWKRVWIVQEVGLAERLIVCFGTCVTDWVTFIRLLTVKNVGSNGPMKLNDLRQRRYEGSRDFLQLLREYRDAECEKRRDKVYGLVGLASDVHFFPVDYRKSLFEIWRDVMIFANGHGLLAEDEIISVGGLVKYILMGAKCEPLDQMLRSYKPAQQDAVALIEDPGSPQVFRVPAKVLGCVKNVSFRPDEIIDDPNKQEMWEQTVQRYYRKDAGRAHAESDMLLRMILRSGSQDPTTACFTYSSGVQWTESVYTRDQMLDIWVGNTINRLQEMSNGQASAPESNKPLESPAETARLYQLECFFGRNDWKMGIASAQVQLGDLICWVESSRMAVILRPRTDTYNFTFRAVGTAFVATDLRGISISDHRERYKSFPQPRGPEKANLPVHLDATFLFILLDDASLGKCS